MIFGYPIWAVIVICVGVFLASFVDAIGGGGGIISLPTYLIAGMPMHFALGTGKLASCLGTDLVAAIFIFLCRDKEEGMPPRAADVMNDE